MKKTITILSAAALAFAMAGPVAAQMRPDAAKADNGYLNSHPELEHKLEKDPSKIDSQKFVDNHPGLGAYLHEHPNVRHKFKSHPNRFMHRAEQYNERHG
jgi:hypothetical protein